MKRRIFLWAAAIMAVFVSACAPGKTDIEPIVIGQSEVDEYLTDLPEYDKISVSIKKSVFTEDLTDEYIERYYEKLAEGREGLFDAKGNLLPLSEETIKLLNIPAFSTVGEFKVFVRNVVQGFIDKENEDKTLAAALEIMRADAKFTDIPEGYILTFKEKILSEYEEIAAGYGISPEYYLKLSSHSLEDEARTAAMNELIYLKLASRIGLEYTSEEELHKGVSDYLLSIIKTGGKK